MNDGFVVASLVLTALCTGFLVGYIVSWYYEEARQHDAYDAGFHDGYNAGRCHERDQRFDG